MSTSTRDELLMFLNAEYPGLDWYSFNDFWINGTYKNFEITISENLVNNFIVKAQYQTVWFARTCVGNELKGIIDYIFERIDQYGQTNNNYISSN